MFVLHSGTSRKTVVVLVFPRTHRNHITSYHVVCTWNFPNPAGMCCCRYSDTPGGTDSNWHQTTNETLPAVYGPTTTNIKNCKQALDLPGQKKYEDSVQNTAPRKRPKDGHGLTDILGGSLGPLRERRQQRTEVWQICNACWSRMLWVIFDNAYAP